MRSRLAALLFSLLTTAPAALAHDLWLESGNSAQVLYQGHRHSPHQGSDLEPYDPALFQSLRCAPGAGQTRLSHKAYPLRFEGDCALLQLTLSSGYWTKTPWETRNAPKTGISSVLKSWRSEETLNHLSRWGSFATQPLGASLEVLPVTDPFRLHSGDKLTVRVFVASKPVAGIPVAYGDNTRGVTGPDGSIAIRLRHGGMQLISASQETPLDDGKADVLIRTAVLQFELSE